MTMRFEKWQALGNDYLIVERDELPVRADAGARAAAVRGALRRVRRRRAAALAAQRAPRTSPTCGSSTPTARRPSCRATARARRSSTCAAAAGPTTTSFSIHTAAGTIRPTITGPDSCRVDMGQARAELERLPRRPARRRGRAARRRAGGAASAGASSTSRSATRSARSRVADPGALAALDLAAIGPRDRSHPEFPNRTNVSWYAELEPARRRASARGSSSAGWGRRSPRAPARRGAAVAYLLDGRRRPPGAAGRRASSSCSTAASSRSRWRGPARAPDRLGAARCSRRVDELGAERASQEGAA